MTKKIEVFASEALPGELEEFPDIKRGWGTTKESTGGIPPMKWFNAIQKRTDEAINGLYTMAIGGYSFADGATLESEKDFIYDVDSKSWYFWSGEFPKIVSSGSKPDDEYWVSIGGSGSDIIDILSSKDGANYIGVSENQKLSDILSQVFNASSYGLSESNDAESNSKALKALSEDVVSKGCGIIIIPPGTYKVGYQKRNSGAEHDPDIIRAYAPQDCLRLQGLTGDVSIFMYGATLILDDGLRFGAFNPETGEPRPYSPTSNDMATRGDTGFIFNIVENPNSNITIAGGVMNGNMSNLILGGQWGDVGRQCDGYGMRIRNYKSLTIMDMDIIKMPLDGVYTGDGWYANKYKQPKPTNLYNVKISGCGRDNWSITGNGHYSAQGCYFSEAAQYEVSSNPASNINVETEAGKVYQVVIDNCVLSNGRDANFIVTSKNVNGLYINNTLIYHDEEFFTKGASAGVWMRGSPVRLHKCTFRNSRILNQAGGKGGSMASSALPIVDDCIITNVNIDGTTPSSQVALINSDKHHMLLRDCKIVINNPETGKYSLQMDNVTIDSCLIKTTGEVKEVDSYTGIIGFIRNCELNNTSFYLLHKDSSKTLSVDFNGTNNFSRCKFISNKVNLPFGGDFSGGVLMLKQKSSDELPANQLFTKGENVLFSDMERKTVVESGINSSFNHTGSANNGRFNGISNNPFKVGDLITINKSLKSIVIESGSDYIDTTSMITMGEAVVSYRKPTLQ